MIQMASREKRYAQGELLKKGFGNLPGFVMRPDLDKATPVVLLTNCCIYPFNKGKYICTKTKTYYPPTGKHDLVNVTAATAIKLIDKGMRVIVHLPQDVEDRVEKLFRMHPSAHLISFLRGDIYSFSFIEKLYGVTKTISEEKPISRLDLCLYDSYASGLERPFIPMFEDSAETASALAEKRIHFIFNMGMIGYDLLLNRGQNEFRLVCPTALATKRPSAHLFTDTIHKAISNVALVTLGYEMPYYTEKQVYIVEIAPGIVDTGMYDDRSVREYTSQEAKIDGFPMDADFADINLWPMLSIEHIAQAVYAYLTASIDDNIDKLVDPEVIDCTLAGRKRNVFLKAFRESINFKNEELIIGRKLPEYCYAPGITWNGLPKLRSGYIPIMLTPPGQYF